MKTLIFLLALSLALAICFAKNQASPSKQHRAYIRNANKDLDCSVKCSLKIRAGPKVPLVMRDDNLYLTTGALCGYRQIDCCVSPVNVKYTNCDTRTYGEYCPKGWTNFPCMNL